MFAYAHDPVRGVLVTRHAAGGHVRDSITELGRAVAAFDTAPYARTKVHLLVVEAGAQLPSLEDRESLSSISQSTRSDTWFACVTPTVAARLGSEIVFLLAPARANRCVGGFDDVSAAVRWLLSVRPDAHAVLDSFLRETARSIAQSAQSSPVVLGDSLPPTPSRRTQ